MGLLVWVYLPIFSNILVYRVGLLCWFYRVGFIVLVYRYRIGLWCWFIIIVMVYRVDYIVLVISCWFIVLGYRVGYIV